MRQRRGTALLVLLLLSGYAITFSRAVLHDGGPPAFFVESRPGVMVLLGDGFSRTGVHQFSDGANPESVMEMAGLAVAEGLRFSESLHRPLLPGERLDVVRSGSQVAEIRRSWMPAAQRMALGIALHPDRMGCEDWQALPGIGAKMARIIEEERQRNGDFGSLEGLERVRGIGSRRIEAWRKFFR